MATSLSLPGLPHDSLSSSKPITQTAVYAQMTCTDCLYALQWDAFPTRSKLPLPMGRSGASSNTWFPGPTQVISPNGIWIGSAVFVGLTSVTDRQTDHTTRSVTILATSTYVVLQCGLIIATRMWVNAQGDGRPAEYRWRPLFNAAKFGSRPLLECHAVMLLSRETVEICRGAPNSPTDLSR